MVQLPALHLQDRQTIFIELDSPLQLDDAHDPIYPYTPPSLVQTIAQLRKTTAPGTVEILVLSVPHVPRDDNVCQALLEMSKLLGSVACSNLAEVRILGSTYPLNNRCFLGACARLPAVTSLNIQLSGLVDSYSLAAVLCAFDKVTKLGISLPTAVDVRNIHNSFSDETKHTFHRLQHFALDLQDNSSEGLERLLGFGSLMQLTELHISFADGWSVRSSEVLLSALSGDQTEVPSLLRLDVKRQSGQTRCKKDVELHGLHHMLTRLSNLQSLTVSSACAHEALLLSLGLADLNLGKLKSLHMHNAYVQSPSKTLTTLLHGLYSLPALRDLRFDGFQSDVEQEGAGATLRERKVVCVGHAFTGNRTLARTVLGALADSLEHLDIAHCLILRSETRKQERLFVRDQSS